MSMSASEEHLNKCTCAFASVCTDECVCVCVPVFEEWRPAADELDCMGEKKKKKSCAPKSLRE